MMEQTLGMLRGALAQAVARDEAKASARSAVGGVGGAGVAKVATVTSGSPAPTREASPRGPEAATEPRPEGSPATVRGVATPATAPAPVTVSHAWSRYNALKRDELVAAEDTEGPGVTIVAKPAQFVALRYRSTRYDACVTRVSEIQNPVSLVSVVTGMSDSLRKMLSRCPAAVAPGGAQESPTAETAVSPATAAGRV